MMIVVLCEEPRRKTAVNSHEIQDILNVSRSFGCRIYLIPPDLTYENDLSDIPNFTPPVLGVCVGNTPTLEHYTTIYAVANNKGIRLINSPQQHQTVTEFDHFYPLLHGITPESVIVDSIEALENVVDRLQFPVFVKGSVKSYKELGWSAVVAHDMLELKRLARNILLRPNRARGKVVVRELVPLRHIGLTPEGFPISREYRIFIYEKDVVAYGFYWYEFPYTEPLSDDDKQTMLGLALEAAERVKVPYLSVDVGQLDTGEWIVIELGDAQFCGFSDLTVALWNKIKDFT